MKKFIVKTLLITVYMQGVIRAQEAEKPFMTLRKPTQAEIDLTNQIGAIDKQIVALMKEVNNEPELKKIDEQIMALHKELAQARTNTFNELGIPALQEKIVSAKATAAQTKQFQDKQAIAEKQLESIRIKTLEKLGELTKKRNGAAQTIIDKKYPQIKQLQDKSKTLEIQLQQIRKGNNSSIIN